MRKTLKQAGLPPLLASIRRGIRIVDSLQAFARPLRCFFKEMGIQILAYQQTSPYWKTSFARQTRTLHHKVYIDFVSHAIATHAAAICTRPCLRMSRTGNLLHNPSLIAKGFTPLPLLTKGA